LQVPLLINKEEMNREVSSLENLRKLQALIYESVPKFKEIDKAIQEVHPAILSLEIEKDVGFAYMMDYYFRFMNPVTVRAIFSHPLFTEKALQELFYCHITSIHKAILQKKPVPDLISSYWKNLTKAEYAILFQNTLQRTFSLKPAIELIQKIDLVHVKILTQSGKVPSQTVLKLFKEMGSNLKKLFSEDLNFYDYVFNLAAKESDLDFLQILEEYAVLFVQLRIAGSFVQEMEADLSKNGKTKPTYPELHRFFAQVPVDSLEITLEIFHEKGWVTAQEKDLILESFLKKNLKKVSKE